MPTRNIFHWIDGRGWLILSGGNNAEGEIRALALGRVAADGGIAYITMGGGLDAAERALEDMEDLGAPSGYLVDVTAEDDETVTAKLADTGMVVIESSADAPEARSLLLGAAADGIQAAYENGAVVLVEGMSAQAMGAWVVLEGGGLTNGLEWLSGALIAPGVTQVAAWARDMLLAQPLAFAIGIGVGSALALGPDGQVELWGSQEITIALGRNFTAYTEDN